MIRFASVARFPSISASCSISALDLIQNIIRNYIYLLEKPKDLQFKNDLKMHRNKKPWNPFAFSGEPFFNICLNAKLQENKEKDSILHILKCFVSTYIFSTMPIQTFSPHYSATVPLKA